IAEPPAVGTIQISLCRLFSDSRTVVTVIATFPPSGESDGALTVVTLYQSSGVKACLAAAGCCAPAIAAGNSKPTAAAECSPRLTLARTRRPSARLSRHTSPCRPYQLLRRAPRRSNSLQHRG